MVHVKVVYVALGSNLAEPFRQLRSAKLALENMGKLTGYSSIYRTKPVGGPTGQDDYLNAVVRLEPTAHYDPHSFLTDLHAIERRHGRTRLERWGARTLDLDILAWGDDVIEQQSLSVPHPRMLERAFVLVPLCELEPAWTHPVTGQKVCELVAELDISGIVKTNLAW